MPMNVDGKHYRTIWLESPGCVRIIDQALLPHEFALMDLRTPEEMCAAIRHMNLRGAGLIGCAAAWGVYLAVPAAMPPQPDFAARLQAESAALLATRPTARNLEWAVVRMQRSSPPAPLLPTGLKPPGGRPRPSPTKTPIFPAAWANTGSNSFAKLPRARVEPVNILTHCNAGWLAFVDHGTALAPVYAALMPASPSTSGWTKPARATRGPRSPRGNWATTACPIR
jgi:methylthioribose-1-phosphate isomerase